MRRSTNSCNSYCCCNSWRLRRVSCQKLASEPFNAGKRSENRPILVATDTLRFWRANRRQGRERDRLAGAIEPGRCIRELCGAHQERPTDRPLPVRPRRADHFLEGERARSESSLSAVIEKGKRAVTVAVDDVRGVAGFIFPGDFVDVALTRTDNSNGPQNFSAVILQHVKVLAIDQMAGQRQEHPTVAKAVTVEVDPDQALRILLAANVGKLSLILRQPAEVALGSRCEDHRSGPVRDRRGAGARRASPGPPPFSPSPSTRRLAARPAASGSPPPSARSDDPENHRLSVGQERTIRRA